MADLLIKQGQVFKRDGRTCTVERIRTTRGLGKVVRARVVVDDDPTRTGFYEARIFDFIRNWAPRS